MSDGVKKRRRASTPRIQYVQQRPSWINLPSWLTLTIALCLNFISVGYTWATMEAKIERNMQDILRNEREDRERAQTVQRDISNLSNQLATMNQLRTDVEVMKNQLQSISETLRRLEARFDSATQAHLKKVVTPPMP
mgnify:FL=1